MLNLFKHHVIFKVWTYEWECDVTCRMLGIYKTDVEGLSLHVKLVKGFVIEIEYPGTLLTLYRSEPKYMRVQHVDTENSKLLHSYQYDSFFVGVMIKAIDDMI